ncbi:MAG TPA: cytochrome c oxidase assembly protein [Gaiellaceae bacterium]|nr:cytochrome c oxidase assembly protein [Gaiellaceae bacterium]
MDPYAWSWNPEALFLVPAATVAYLWLTRPGRYPAGPWRTASFLAAMALLLAITITPFETIALRYLLWVHLLQNVVLAEWAPLLVVLGIPPALAAVAGRAGAVRVLTHPLVALPLWLGTYAFWHVPPVYDAALGHAHSLLHLEHATYFLTGVALWWSVFQDEPHRLPSVRRAVYVFAAFVLSAPLGLVLALVPEPVYDFYADAPERLWGLSRIADQQLGGITMASEQAVVFFAVFAVLCFRFFAEQEHHEDDEVALGGPAGRST